MERSDPSRNAPLLPRSASFGQGRQFEAFTKASAYASHLHRACQGDEFALKSACILAIVGAFTVGLLGALSPWTVRGN